MSPTRPLKALRASLGGLVRLAQDHALEQAAGRANEGLLAAYNAGRPLVLRPGLVDRSGPLRGRWPVVYAAGRGALMWWQRDLDLLYGPEDVEILPPDPGEGLPLTR